MPSQLLDPEQYSPLFDDESWVDAPVHMGYGANVRLVYLNHNCTILDSCLVSIESPALVGPKVLTRSYEMGLEIQRRVRRSMWERTAGLTAVPSSCRV